MRVSVIVSTYNAPAWLEKVLWGYAAQTHRDFELVVADDGSTQDTALLLGQLRRQTQLPIRHVWQERSGFRKCEILNKATVAAAGDYLIYTDGDCIPRCDFVEQHAEMARPATMLSGGCVRLPKDLSQRITVEDVLAGRATDPRWLLRNGLRLSKKLLMLTCGPRSGDLLDLLTPTRATFNGGNSSAWKGDVLRVNGFDERMGHGGLDRELGERLANAGVRGKQIRHRAICVHLDHDRGYRSQEALDRNLAIRRETRCSHAVWTPYGIDREERLAAKAA